MAEPELKPRRRRSVYDERARENAGTQPEPEGRPLAESDPLTGMLRWRDDWAQQATGWFPLDSFLRGR